MVLLAVMMLVTAAPAFAAYGFGGGSFGSGDVIPRARGREKEAGPYYASATGLLLLTLLSQLHGLLHQLGGALLYHLRRALLLLEVPR
jgi:hypothetical protein